MSDDNSKLVVAGEGAQEKTKSMLIDTGTRCGNMTGPTKPALSCDITTKKPMKVLVAGEDHGHYVFKGPPFTR